MLPWPRQRQRQRFHTFTIATASALWHTFYNTHNVDDIEMVSPLTYPFSIIRKHVPSQELNVIFDVGANTGQSCIEYASCLPDAKIYAFEPVPTNFADLRKKTQEIKNISIHNIGIGEDDGVMRMLLSTASTMHRVTPASMQSRPIDASNIEVQAKRLNTFCFENRVPFINFLKIDTEGHDHAVLKGCGDFIRNIDFVQCEASANSYNKFHNSFVDIFNFMTNVGFYLFHIEGFSYEWGGGGYPILRRLDPLFINSRIVGPLRNVLTQ
jgi:FkbM family methyltransferase